jgi:cytochrome P450
LQYKCNALKPIPKRLLIPIITDLREYRQAANDTISYSRDIVNKYGDVCEASFTGIKNYFIHDPEVIKEVLTTQSAKFKRTKLFRAFRKFLGNGLFTADDPYHKQQRRMIKPAFLPQRVEGYAEAMVQCATEEMSTWKDGETININQAMTNITLNVITRTLFGSSLPSDTIKAVRDRLPAAFNVMSRIVENPLYVYCLEKEIGIPIVKEFFKARAAFDEIIHGIIASYRKDNGNEKQDLLALLMSLKDEDTGKGMTDEEIRDEVITFFIAGHETTTLALSWSWYLIGGHPQVANAFYEEVKNGISNSLPTAKDYQALPLTKNIFKESLRLYPPAWTFAREAMEDIVIRDYHFPKGAILWTVTYLVHHNEKYFEQAEEFIPSRWDTEQIKAIPKYAYFPFGGGNRMCIGEGFAWMEGVLVLATIASKFRLHMPAGFTTAINPVFTLKMTDDLLMKVERI